MWIADVLVLGSITDSCKELVLGLVVSLVFRMMLIIPCFCIRSVLHPFSDAE